jgi:hypothetical protein
MSPRRVLSFLLALAFAAAACGSPAPSAAPSASPSGSSAAAVCATAPDPTPSDAWNPQSTTAALVPVIVSNAITCGKVRFIFLFVDSANVDKSTPDLTAKLAFYNLGRDPNKVVATADGAFVWTIQDQRGMYIANIDLPEAGTWGVEFTTQTPGSPAQTARVTFSVLDFQTSIAVGQKAPASKTPTAASVGGDLAKISTDPKPDAAFYQTSVADALAAKKPFIVIFATPKFCTSAQCGPTLDMFKPVAAAHPDVTFINVEPYNLAFKDGSLQPVLDAQGHLVATDISNEWGLLAEPWMFAVDRNGVVRGSYLLTMSDAEVNEILPVISAGS